MPIASRTFRVFVSSTFEDLKEERDALQRHVFPKLRTLCEQHGARFQAIDLRWGVRDEAALDQQTMEICLREIERCRATGVRPNFIALLGDRYGWQPPPARIPATEFDALKPHLPSGDVVARADRWYQLDENAFPPEYCLQPRTGEFVDSDVWNPVEQALLQALANAARAAGLLAKELIKYEASATHQEILAGLGDSEEDRQHIFGFVRRPSGNTDPRVEELKSHLRVHEFDAGDMKGLCALVFDHLSEVIERQVKRFADRPALDLEIEAHDRFAEDRSRIFIGRDVVLKRIADYISGPERLPLLLHGESGSGKSAVMAKASQQYNVPGRVIRRFIGASQQSASGHTLLTSLCRQISSGEIPADYAQLENAFRERLAANAEQPLVLFIDALDQLAASDPARRMNWLPPRLPPYVKVIISTTDDGERLPGGLPVRLERMAQSEGGQALDELLREAHRELQSSQRATVLTHFERCGLPLYLKLAAEESRLWKSYTPQDACTLGEGVAGVIDTLIDRLASNSNHGPTLVERSLGYLAAARYGLTEDEVLDVLTEDDTVWNDFDQRRHHEVSERRLPVVVWSRLSLDLEPYLTERAAPGGTVIAFYHRQLAERVAERYLMKSESMGRHETLANHFARLPTFQPDVNLRKVSELPYHQTLAGLWDAAERTLCDLEFAEAKIAATMLHDLIQDCDRVLGEHEKPAVKVMRRVLALSLRELSRRPDLALQTMYNRLTWIQESEHGWQQALRAAETRLNSQSMWLRAEAPLPGSETGVVFDGEPAWQFLRQSEGLIVAVARDGEVETREIGTGSLVSRRRLGSRAIRGASAMPKGDRVAWLDSSGVLHAERTDHVLASRRDDTVPLWHTRGCIVSVGSDNTLVSWNPDNGQIAVLLDNIPKPLRLLKSSSDRRSLLLAAGNKAQLLVLLSEAETGWHLREIPLECAPIVDADWDIASDLLLLACEDRHLRLSKLASVASKGITADLAYELWQQPQIIGRPRRCALVLQDGVTRAFFATDRGHIACWEPTRPDVVRMQDYKLPGLFVFEALAGSATLYISDSNGCAVAREYSESNDAFKPGGIVRHRTEVNSCAFTANGNIVSACYRESTIIWSSVDLRLSHLTVLPGVTAIVAAPDSDSILTGDGYGRVCRVSAGQPGGSGQLLGSLALDGAVCCVVSDGPVHAIASGSLGRVVRVSLRPPGPPETLRIGGPYREQIELLPAGSDGKFWSLRLDSSDGGQRQSVLSLLKRSGHEVVLLSSVWDLQRIATTDDGSRLCTFGSVVRVLQRTRSGLEEQYRRDAAALRVAFLCDGEFLAVVPPDRAWIEIWRVSDGLPTVGCCYLQTAVECLATAKNRIVAGLVSGELASLSVGGTSVLASFP